MEKIKAGIIGGAGFTGGEMLRLLLRHPNVEICCVHSRSMAGKPVTAAHPDLFGETNLVFGAEPDYQADVLFLCLGHGESVGFVQNIPASASPEIIDLSQDFRLSTHANSQKQAFVYGLPELNRDRIRLSGRVANPGCFATAIQLALLPLARKHLLTSEIHISAITGSTGAGQKLTPTTGFTWRNNNLSVYKAFTHQHLAEIGQSLQQLQPGYSGRLHFIPYRGNFTRGILASVYLPCKLSAEEAQALYQEYYKSHPFTHVVSHELDLKQVVNTNKCFLHIEKHEDMLLITSVIDNLLKGASGQAVQNMNLMFGLKETAGLLTKPIAF